ncbi:MAG: hemerythrin domain-containing protein [Pseudomonadota bacterium]
MHTNYNIRIDDMPSEMNVLLDLYPRDGWEDHPGFKAKTRQWMNAHQMFRGLTERILSDTEGFLDKRTDSDTYAGRLSHFGGALVGNLHGHHGWEDHVYFPELSAADPRFEAGLELLEQDHADLDQVLEQFTTTANRVIKLSQLDETQAYDEAGSLHQTSEAIRAFLKRHLSDEEELAVPIILHHRLRG